MIFTGKRSFPLLLMGMVCVGGSIDSIRDTLPDAAVLDGFAIQEQELQDVPAEVSE